MPAFLRYRLITALSIVFALLFLPAANASIITQLQGKRLHVIGDSQDNSVVIEATGVSVIVTSTDTNPATVHTFPKKKVRNITVATMAGDDEVVFSSLVQPDNGSKNTINIEVQAGADADTIRVNGYWGRANIFAASGTDEIDIGSLATGAKFDGRLTISAGSGSDSISLMNTEPGKKTTIQGGDGDDNVTVIDNSFTGNFRLRTGRGDDVVTFVNNSKATNAPYKLHGGKGHSDSLTGKFDLAEMNIAGFEEIVQIPDDPILITGVNRSTFARASYDSDFGPPPNNEIQDLDQQELSSDEIGAWDGSVRATILEDYEVPAPITASAGHVSDVAVSGGSLDIDHFVDPYWGSQPFGFLPFGSARSNSSYEVTFLVNVPVTLTVNGFLSTNRASGGYPLALASFRVIERGQTDVTLVQRTVSEMSDVMFNDLVETLDGTSVVLEAGKTYAIVVATSASESFIQRNAEAEVSLTWSIN